MKYYKLLKKLGYHLLNGKIGYSYVIVVKDELNNLYYYRGDFDYQKIKELYRQLAPFMRFVTPLSTSWIIDHERLKKMHFEEIV